MPFITKIERDGLETGEIEAKTPGQKCYLRYKSFMRRWKESPRWTTVDEIAKEIWPEAWKRAAALAFMVFFAMVVLNYEELKKKENGDIE